MLPLSKILKTVCNVIHHFWVSSKCNLKKKKPIIRKFTIFLNNFMIVWIQNLKKFIKITKIVWLKCLLKIYKTINFNTWGLKMEMKKKFTVNQSISSSLDNIFYLFILNFWLKYCIYRVFQLTWTLTHI